MRRRRTERVGAKKGEEQKEWERKKGKNRKSGREKRRSTGRVEQKEGVRKCVRERERNKIVREREGGEADIEDVNL